MSFPSRTIPKAQPGESERFHESKSVSTLVAFEVSEASSANADNRQLSKEMQASKMKNAYFTIPVSLG